jgi:hypothetical protein
MQYSSEEELGGVLHKHLGYASVAFDKAVKLAEFIAALKADPELHKRMQATVAANPTWFDMGEKKQTWAQAVSLATSSATLPSSNSSSSSKRTDNLYPSPGTSTITSSTPHPSGPASVSASGSGGVQRNAAIEQSIEPLTSAAAATAPTQALPAALGSPTTTTASVQKASPVALGSPTTTTATTTTTPSTSGPQNDLQSDGRDSASYDPSVNTHFELPTLHWKGLTFTAEPTSDGVKGNCWVTKSVEGDTHFNSDLSFVRFARFDSHSRSPSPGSPPRSSRPPSPGTPDGTPPGTPHGPPPGPPPNSYLYSTQ